MTQVIPRLVSMIGSIGLLRTLGYVVFTIFLERTGLYINVVFMREINSFPSELDQGGFSVSVARHMEDICKQDFAILLEYGGIPLIESFRSAFAAGKCCFTLRFADFGVAAVCWIERIDEFSPASNAPCVLISRCFTLPKYRGIGLYPALLRVIDGVLPENMRGVKTAVIECSFFNYASRRGIVKAGFKRCGVAVEFPGKRFSWRRS